MSTLFAFEVTGLGPEQIKNSIKIRLEYKFIVFGFNYSFNNRQETLLLVYSLLNLNYDNLRDIP